ncbi:hemerythrin domain-containing protein [Dactylosporangium sp. McL0621]|uniref:hemerythrin domain-containing protein n=1 Tax=Dactylosporangium sp. McL0621 TaxID=3415678 RepID=UPI003CF7F793
MPSGGGLDLTAMYAMHHALRRQAAHLARLTVRVGDDPGRIRPAAAGWQLFKRALRIHHTAEDRALWPPMRRALAGRPGDLVLLEAMEAEHAGIDQLITTIDAAVADLDAVGLGDLVDALVVGVCGHLDHEERRALPLIQATVTAGQWQRFEHIHAALAGADAPRLLEPPRRACHQRRWPDHTATTTTKESNIVSTVRIHTYRVDPANLEQLLAQRANLIAGIRAGNPGLLEARLTRHEDGTYTDAWRWQSAEQMAAALAGAAGFPLVGATLALTHDASVQNGEIVDER